MRANFSSCSCLEVAKKKNLYWVSMFLLAAALTAKPVKSIAVSATTVPTYVRPVDAQGKPRVETYIFTQGIFFEGSVLDQRLSQTRFEAIVQTLAPHLAKQNYLPTKDVPAADLLLVVHWGTTTIFDDPEKGFLAERAYARLQEYAANADEAGDADPGALNSAIGDQAYSQDQAQGAINRNATLLGYRPFLERERRRISASTEEQRMTAELGEERYFVILLAYDYQYFRREHKSRRLWATRISVRSPGTNFTEALPAIAQAGTEGYGRQLDRLARVTVAEPTGSVELGELKFLGPTESGIAPVK